MAPEEGNGALLGTECPILRNRIAAELARQIEKQVFLNRLVKEGGKKDREREREREREKERNK